MKDSKRILTKHFLLCVLLQVLAVVLLSIPPLQPYREKAATLLHLPAAALWIPTLAVLVIANILILRRLDSHLVQPLRHLVSQTKHSSSSFAFKKKSMNTEEDHLKHFIESYSLKFIEMEQELARMENEIQKTAALAQVSPEEIESLRASVEDAAEQKNELLAQIAAFEKTKTADAREIDRLRRELKTQAREIEDLQNAANNTADLPTETDSLSSMLAERLRDPLNLIGNLAWRLSKSWDDTPPSKIREGLDEINHQAEEQLELLKKYQAKPAPLSKEERA